MEGYDLTLNPDEIYQRSFSIIRSEACLEGLTATMENLVVRIIHSCGIVEVADRLIFSEKAAELGAIALEGGANILVDTEMVEKGIIRGRLPMGNNVICTLNNQHVPKLVRNNLTTRSAAAVELWSEHLEGAVVAIGNAPTALFHLLAMIEAGAPKPSLILGFPVGFVGAAESKQALAENSFGLSYITLPGRLGGSAMAAASVNALTEC